MSLAFERVRPRARLLLAAIAVAGATAIAGCGDDSASAGRRPHRRDWALPNADVHNTRRTTGPIDSSSVARLRVAWRLPLDALFTATPIVVDDVAYVQDMDSDVSAIDLETGKVLWTRRYHSPDTGPNGVNVADGRVYGATLHEVFSLDQQSGRELWSTNLTRVEGEIIDMAPGVHDGLVYVSTVPGNHEVVGTIWALDAGTGRRAWKWEEVPAGLWGRPEVNAGGGAWHTPAFDDSGNLYIGLANPVAWPGVTDAPMGRSRPGDNRWSNSLVKLDARTGRLIWARQVIPHDVYDWDLQCPVILVRVDGRQVAIAAGKMGIVYAFDAGSGRLLWKRSVGIHNGHDDDNLAALRGDYSFFRPGERILPGVWGGVQTQMASDGRTVFAPVNNLYAVYADGIQQPAKQDLMEGTGEVVAIDVASGRVRWTRRLPHSTYGAATISNDVVFTTTLEGTLWALDIDDGRVLWRSHLPEATDAPVAIAGDMLLTAASLPWREQQHLAIVAYRLGPGR